MITEQHVASDVNVCKKNCGFKCVSWSSILVAAFVALGLSFLLNLFSTAIGLSIYSVSPEGVKTLTVGGMLGFAIGIIVSMFFSGWIAGHFGRCNSYKKCCGALAGLASWCVALVIMVALAFPLATFVGNYANFLANTTVTANTAMVDTSNRNNVAMVDTNNRNNAAVVIPTDKETAGDLSKGAFVLFLMFFLGALSSTCGGYVGACACQNKDDSRSCQCGKCCK